MIWYKRLKQKFRSGSLFSRLFRVFFEKQIARPLMGLQLFAGVFFLGPLSSTQTSDVSPLFPVVGTSEVVVVPVEEEPHIVSVKTMQNPVIEFIGVSTFFQSGHLAYDLRASLGSSVYPAMGGRVKSIVHSTHGYGRHIIIDHENGFESLYAHMGLITVEEGEEVRKETKIGEVGLTGFTTGPHVHFELHKDGAAVNPGNYIDLSVLPTEQ